jgi:hypothetical protein
MCYQKSILDPPKLFYKNTVLFKKSKIQNSKIFSGHEEISL